MNRIEQGESIFPWMENACGEYIRLMGDLDGRRLQTNLLMLQLFF